MATLAEMWQDARAEAEAEAIKHYRLLSYWNHLFDAPLCAPQEFYNEVDQNLALRNVPDLERGVVLLREKNALSKSRLYLHFRRERLVFEICAAPFGSGYFVSSRLFDRRRVATWWDYLFFFGSIIAVDQYLTNRTDFYIAIVLIGFLLSSLWSTMILASTNTIKWLDQRLYVMPFVGPIYESWFHPLTYFREDQNNMYREVVHRAVLETIDSVTAEKGLKPLTDDERKPLIWELFSR